METFSDKVKKEIGFTREIPIKFPLDVYKEFSTFAKEESGDCYWLAIKRLMSEKRSSDRYNKLEERLDRLERTLEPSDGEEKTEIKTFGKKKGDKK